METICQYTLYPDPIPSGYQSTVWTLLTLSIHRPSRFGAQSEAVNIIFNSKTLSNPESSVGLMSMAGKTPEVLVTLTTDIGKILDGLHRTKIRGNAHLATAIQVAEVGTVQPTATFLTNPGRSVANQPASSRTFF
jgi:hypothetical protein